MLGKQKFGAVFINIVIVIGFAVLVSGSTLSRLTLNNPATNKTQIQEKIAPSTSSAKAFATQASDILLVENRVTDGDMMSKSPIIEFFTFKLKAGVTDEQYHEKHALLLEEFFRKQDGFSSSQSWKSEDGTWALVNIWRTQSHADAAGEVFGSLELGQEWTNLIDDSASVFHHFSIERRDF